MVPRSISRVTDSAVKISIVSVRMVPISPGTMLSWLDAGRVVAGVCANFERRRAGVGNGAIVPERHRQQIVERAQAPSRSPPDRWRRPPPAAPACRRAATPARNRAGISTANSTSPDASTRSISASSRNCG